MVELAFIDVLRSAKAAFGDDGTTALSFGNARAEYDAALSGCALFDVNRRTQLEITGDDRVTFLNSFCTNDIKRLTPGAGRAVGPYGRVLGAGSGVVAGMSAPLACEPARSIGNRVGIP